MRRRGVRRAKNRPRFRNLRASRTFALGRRSRPRRRADEVAASLENAAFFFASLALTEPCILRPPRRDVCPRWRDKAAAGYHMMVNCAPAKCLCLPDLVPAQAFVRAGAAGGIRNAGDRRGWHCGSGGAVCHRFTPGLAVLAPTFCLSLRRAGAVILRWRGCVFSGRRAGTFVRAGAAAAVRPPLNAAAGYHMMVNCAPAKCFCLPDLVPAQAFVRAGAAGGIRNAGDRRGWHCGSGGAVCHRFTPGLAVLAPTFCLSLRPALRFYRRVLPQFMPGLATLARLLPSVRAFELAVLAERLSSVCAR